MLQAVNVTVAPDGATKIEMRVSAGKNRSQAQLWAQLQHQVKCRAVISKWVNVVKEGKKVNLTLQTSATSGRHVRKPKRANQKGQRLEIKSNLFRQYQKDESHRETKRALTELFIKMLGLFKELPLDAVVPVAKFLLIFSCSIQVLEEILEDDSSEDALRREIMILIMNLLIILQLLEETNQLGSNVLWGGMQIATSNKLILIPVLGSIGLMNLPGANACHSTNLGINQMSGKEEKKLESFEALAWTLVTTVIGVAAWRMFRRPARVQAFAVVDEGLKNSPIPRKSNPNFEIRPAFKSRRHA